MSEGLVDGICGALSGVFTNLLTHPLDTIKCRMQTDSKQYGGFINTTRTILKNEHFLGFYKGIFANTMVNVPIASVYSYYKFKLIFSLWKNPKIHKTKKIDNQ
jgi:hypothetical protein